MSQKPKPMREQIKDLKKEVRSLKKDLRLASAFIAAVSNAPDPDRPPIPGVNYKVVEADPIKDHPAYGT